MCNLSDGIEKKALKEGWEKGHKKGRKEGREEGREEGSLQVLVSLVKEGLISLSVGATKAGMPEAEFAKLLQ